nr:DNA helicase [Tanacetum cinerariifolium]
MKAICNLDVHVDSKAPKPSSQTEEIPQGKKPGAKSVLRRKQSLKHISESKTEASKSKTGHSKKETMSSLAKDKSPSHLSHPTPVVDEMHKEAQQAAGGPTSLGATNESEEEVDKDDTHAPYHNVPEDTSSYKDELEQQKAKAKAEVASLKARPSYLYINQLTNLLATSLNLELSKLLASHNFASCLPTDLKELPSKFTELSREIKELKQHVKGMEIELPGELKDIPTKLETFTSTISSLTSQTMLKTLDSLSSLLNKVTQTLDRFAIMVDNASRAMTKDVPSVAQVTASPAEGEKNTNHAETNLKDKLIDILGTNIVTQYYNKKLLFDKYYAKILKRKSPKITNCFPFESLKLLQHQLFRSLEDWEVSSLQSMQRSTGKVSTSIDGNKKQIDKIQNYVDSRFRVTFQDREKLDVIVNILERKKTTLTEWTKKSLGRLTHVHPSSSELFYFRMLLCHQKGCCSKHMIANLKLLINFVWKFMGTGRFGNDHVAAILGFGDLQ